MIIVNITLTYRHDGEKVSVKMNNHDENLNHMYPNTNLYGYIDTDIIAKRKAMLNSVYGIEAQPSTAFCNAPHRIRESIANQINFWCTYCAWRYSPITYYVAHERVNVEL